MVKTEHTLTAAKASELALNASRVFSPTAPIDERDLFAGRTDQIRKLIDAINQKGQHAIVFGERGVGDLPPIFSPGIMRLSPGLGSLTQPS